MVPPETCESGKLPGRTSDAAAGDLVDRQMVLGQLVGEVVIESAKPGRFGPDDEALLAVVATMVASAIEIDRAHERAAGDAATTAAPSWMAST